MAEPQDFLSFYEGRCEGCFKCMMSELTSFFFALESQVFPGVRNRLPFREPEGVHGYCWIQYVLLLFVSMYFPRPTIDRSDRARRFKPLDTMFHHDPVEVEPEPPFVSSNLRSICTLQLLEA